MKRCEFEEKIVDLLYDEIDDDDRARIQAHVDGCDTCVRMLEEMRATLHVMSRREREDPGAEFWDGYWDRLAARMEADAREGEPLDTTSRAWWRMRVSGGRTASVALRVAAAAAILVIGIFVGRTYFVPGTPAGDAPLTASNEVRPDAQPGDTGGDSIATQVTPAEQVAEAPVDGGAAVDGGTSDDGGPVGDAPSVAEVPAERPRQADEGSVQLASANERAMSYIGKSQVLLVGLINADPGADGYVASQRSKSRALADEASSIQGDLTDPRQRRLRELVAELEKILTQIANLEEEEDAEAVEFIRGRVDRHDLLLKIDLEQLKHETTGAEGSDTGGEQTGADKGSI